jgi:thiol-disulfide isomerase/thioredoxin
MSQRSVLTGVLVVITVLFGAMIFYDIKHGHKFQGIFGKEKITPNWKWDDNWSDKGPNNPMSPTRPIVEAPVDPQIMAGSYTEALQKSGETGKPVLVFFTAEWCKWCKQMKQETMPDARVQSALKNYILVYVDTDKERVSARKFNVESLPSYVITNVNEDKLKFDSGFKNVESFEAWLNNPSFYVQPKLKSPVDPQKQDDRRRPLRPNPTRPQNG